MEWINHKSTRAMFLIDPFTLVMLVGAQLKAVGV